MAELRVNFRPADRTILTQRSITDYDRTGAIRTLWAFNRFLIDVVARYEGNEQSIMK